MLPKDPVILLGVINTKLRDYYSSLEILCEDLDISSQELTQTLEEIGYQYDRGHNQFV